MSDNERIISETRSILENACNKKTWEDTYEKYAEQITKNNQKYVDNGKLFIVQKPLVVYSTIGKVKTDGKTTSYDLRFAGQSVGLIEVDAKGERKLTVTEKQAVDAKNRFGFKTSQIIEKEDWGKSSKAKEFRKFYYALKSFSDEKRKEHRIESELLKEFSKRLKSQDKKLCNIQPIRLGNRFFQLTTPLKGSTHVPEFSMNEKGGATGGGIDILARIKHKSNKSRIAIIELKDENIEIEPQKDVMLQALIYATFVAELLHSKSGEKWFKIFDYKKTEKHLNLDVVTLMPTPSPDRPSKEGRLDTIEITALDTTFYLYTLYYDVDVIDGNLNAFNGSLIEDILK